MNEQMEKMAAIFHRPEVSGYTLYPSNGYFEVDLFYQQDHTPTTWAKELGLPDFIDDIPVYYEFNDAIPVGLLSELLNRSVCYDPPDVPVQEPTIFADPDYLALRVKQDPIYSGCDVAAAFIDNRFWGTLSGIVWDRDTSEAYFLSCAHVICPGVFRGSTYWPPEDVGTPIYHPRRPNKIGELLRWGTSTSEEGVDAAVATIDPGISFLYDFYGPAGTITDTNAIDVDVGDPVLRVGRSTGSGSGTIYDKNYVFQPADFPPVLTHRADMSPTNVGGDSGSIVIRTSDNKIAGIAIGVVGTRTVIQPALTIEDDLNVTFTKPGGWLAPRAWQDTQTQTDEFILSDVDLTYGWVDEPTFTSTYTFIADYLRDWPDTHEPTSTFTRIIIDEFQNILDWEVNYHNWPSTHRTWQETWHQTSTLAAGRQWLGFSNTSTWIEHWFNPGSIDANYASTQTQIDSFYPFMDHYTISDHISFDDIYDPSFPAKVRSWSDTQQPLSRFDTTNLYDVWLSESKYTLQIEYIGFTADWPQIDWFKPPTQREFTATQYHQHEFWHPWHFAGWQDEWEQSDRIHSLTMSVHIDQFFSDPSSTIMLNDVFVYVHNPVRLIQNTINWSEQWRTVLPTHELEHSFISTAIIDFEPKWLKIEDLFDFTEDWVQTSGQFFDDILLQTSTFNLQQFFQRLTEQLWFSNSQFIFARRQICDIPYGNFALIDDTETLVLRNPAWGDKATLETQRTVGVSRSGMPFVARRAYWPQRKVFNYKIRTNQANDILLFLERNLGKQFWWVDHYGERHRGFCLEPATPIIRRGRRWDEINLVLVDLGEHRCDIKNHLQHAGEYSWQ